MQYLKCSFLDNIYFFEIISPNIILAAGPPNSHRNEKIELKTEEELNSRIDEQNLKKLNIYKFYASKLCLNIFNNLILLTTFRQKCKTIVSLYVRSFQFSLFYCFYFYT